MSSEDAVDVPLATCGGGLAAGGRRQVRAEDTAACRGHARRGRLRGRWANVPQCWILRGPRGRAGHRPSLVAIRRAASNGMGGVGRLRWRGGAKKRK